MKLKAFLIVLKGFFGKVIVDTSYKKTMIARNRIIIFFFTIWLPYGQIWVIIK